eukprot:SAG31_NODE_4953_length_2837_cov_1.979547_2_plen_133_part_00
MCFVCDNNVLLNEDEFDALVRLLRRTSAKRSMLQAGQAARISSSMRPAPPPRSPGVQSNFDGTLSTTAQFQNSSTKELEALRTRSGLGVRDRAKLRDKGLSLGMSVGEAEAAGIRHVDIWTDDIGNIRRGFG